MPFPLPLPVQVSRLCVVWPKDLVSPSRTHQVGLLVNGDDRKFFQEYMPNRFVYDLMNSVGIDLAIEE